MNLEPKIQSPICIRLTKDSNFIMADNNCKIEHQLTQAVLFEGNHYGFVLIIDNKTVQREYVYQTQCKIQAIGMENDFLKIFEEGKKSPWIFNKNGKLEKSAFGDVVDKFRDGFVTLVENYDMFTAKPIVKNPIKINIDRYLRNCVIQKDEFIDKDYPLYPGLVLGTEHYGFIFVIENEYGLKKEIIYPTNNKIDAIGMEYSDMDDIKIYENGKYNPWLFTYRGVFKKKATHNPYSKRDQKFVEKSYDLEGVNPKDGFCLKKII